MHFSHHITRILLLSGSWAFSAAEQAPCSAEAIPPLDVYGTEILSFNATPVLNLSLPSPHLYSLTVDEVTLNFCNVSIQYTHPGYNDIINVRVWLPLGNWNSRFFGTGGGNWAGHLAPWSLIYPVSQGFATVATDTGHDPNLQTPSPWALISPGNINWPLLQDFADTALDEAATIGKAVTVAFYNSPIKYSYFVGCSQGGRFALQLAQRHPTQYDGIIAFAPAANLPTLQVGFLYPLLTMKELGKHLLPTIYFKPLIKEPQESFHLIANLKPPLSPPHRPAMPSMALSIAPSAHPNSALLTRPYSSIPPSLAHLQTPPFVSPLLLPPSLPPLGPARAPSTANI